MAFDWYELLHNDGSITQGDIISNCPIPFFGSSVYEAILKEGDITDVDEPIDVKVSDVIILSQACDILNEKIDSIIVSPVWPLLELIDVETYYKSSKARESLRQGKEPAYHLINESRFPSYSIPFSIVEFHRIYSLPKTYLLAIIIKQENRIRLLPPYREHLSQAFARYFMRVGLPIDIDSELIKNIV